MRRYVILFFIFIASGFLFYFNVLGDFFLSDDFDLIHSVSNFGPFSMWFRGHGGFFRPVIMLSLYADYKLWGLNPYGYHITNILVHSCNAFFVFLIAVRLTDRPELTCFHKMAIPLFSGFIFLALPSHTEAVSWISGRTDLFATFFCLFSFICYLMYRANHKTYNIIISFLLFFIALCSKESVVIYPLIICSCELYYYLTGWKKSFLLPFLYGIIFILYLPVRYIQLGTFIGGYGAKVHFNFTFVHFIKLIFYPCMVFLPPVPEHYCSVALAGIIVLIVLISIISILHNRIMGKFYLFLICLSIISILPVLNLGVSNIDTQGTRLLYLSSCFMSIYLSSVIISLKSNRKLIIVFMVAAVLLSGMSLYYTDCNWHSASCISRSILFDVTALNVPGRLFIPSLPDNFHGAYIYRNGLHNAVSLFRKDIDTKKIKIILFNSLYNSDDKITTVLVQSPGIYRVGLSDKKATFMNANTNNIESTFFNDDYIVFDFKKNSFLLELKNFNEKDRLAVYSSGKLIVKSEK
ncbi:MAG: hypothetical protein ABRQ38_07760 [Candidatus Eremiobacterota bacterium]